VFLVRYGQAYKVELSFKQKTGRWTMSRIVIVILIYHGHKPIDLIVSVLANWHRFNTGLCAPVFVREVQMAD
jgi:hypothetical protein